MNTLFYAAARRVRFWLAALMPGRLAQWLCRTARPDENALRAFFTNVACTQRLRQVQASPSPAQAWAQLAAQADRGWCKIDQLYYTYTFWNASLFREVADRGAAALCCGYLPVIEVCGAAGENLWEAFLRQPFLPPDTLTPAQRQALPRWTRPYGADRDDAGDAQTCPARLRTERALYQLLFCLNDRTAQYIAQDSAQAVGDRRCCGVLGRGTDYLLLRTSAIHRQPTLPQLLDKTAAVMEKNGLEWIYLATEDAEIARAFHARFGDKVRENKRVYYNAAFAQGKAQNMAQAHLGRENEAELRGLEYLSSLVILSRCECLVAGRCGGSEFADMIRPVDWREKCIFALGRYGDTPEENAKHGDSDL